MLLIHVIIGLFSLLKHYATARNKSPEPSKEKINETYEGSLTLNLFQEQKTMSMKIKKAWVLVFQLWICYSLIYCFILLA